jgi:hypothetical protein
MKGTLTAVFAAILAALLASGCSSSPSPPEVIRTHVPGGTTSSGPAHAGRSVTVTIGGYRYSLRASLVKRTLQQGDKSAPPGQHFDAIGITVTNEQHDRTAPFPFPSAPKMKVKLAALPPGSAAAKSCQVHVDRFITPGGDVVASGVCSLNDGFEGGTLVGSSPFGFDPETDSIAAGKSAQVGYEELAPDNMPDAAVSIWVPPNLAGYRPVEIPASSTWKAQPG